MKFRRYNNNDNFKVNLTPLIDTVFILLIFFMMTTTFNRETQLKINLPEANSENSVKQESIRIIIDENGEYAINDFKHVLIDSKLNTLKLALKKAAGEESNPTLLISADKNAPHHAVMMAMEAARDLGFMKLGFEAQKK